MEERIYLAPWIAARSFRVEGDPRVVISNELDHEFIQLDGPAAILWIAIEDAPGKTVKQLALELDYPELEVVYFVRELLDINILCVETPEIAASKVIPKEVKPIHPVQSARYADGSYFEAAPGGDNLEAEFAFQDWALSNGFLWSASWEITYRCNEACVHCFNPGASHSKGQRAMRKTSQLSKDQWQKMLLEMKEIGVFRLLLTGGEVALHKDFFEIVSTARKMGFSVTVFTNGTLFKALDTARLIALYPHRVELTLYSPFAAQHDAITRLKGSFLKTVDCAEQLVAAGVTTAIKMTVMADTAHLVGEFREFVEQMGCEAQPDFNMSPGIDGARDPLRDLLPTPVELIRSAANPKSPLFIGEKENPRKRSGDFHDPESPYVCGAGRTLMSITPEGHIYPCNSLPLHVGSVAGGSLKEVWQDSKLGGKKDASLDRLTDWQNVTTDRYNVCGTFDRCAWCQKCPGMALVETGDELSPSTVNCRNAAARLVAHALQSDGIDPANVQPEDIATLAALYPENAALWNTEKHLASRTDLDVVKQALKDRGMVSVLQENSRVE